MKTIWKFGLGPVPSTLPATYLLENVPLVAEFVHFGLQGDELCLWAIVDTEQPMLMQTVLLIGTGQGYPPEYDGRKYVGSVVVRPTDVVHAILGPRKEYDKP